MSLARLFTLMGLVAMTNAPISAEAQAPKSAHEFVFEAIDGGSLNLQSYAGRPVLIVNTASKCGFTPQYKGLEALWKAKKDAGLVIIGVPSGDFAGQELKTGAEIKSFCELNYGVTFPLAAKQKVTGNEAHAFYQWAKTAYAENGVPKWNFHKLLIDKAGRPVAGFGSSTTPDDKKLLAAIDAALD